MNLELKDRFQRWVMPCFAILLGTLMAAECKAQITILEPRSGDVYERGDNLTIRWECPSATMATDWDVNLIFTDETSHLFGRVVSWSENWSRVRRSIEGGRLVCVVHNVHLHNKFLPGDYAVQVRGTGGFSDDPSEERIEQTQDFRVTEGRWIDVSISPDPSSVVRVTERLRVSWNSHNITAPVTLKISVPSFDSISPTEEVLATDLPIAGSFEWTASQGRLIGPDLPSPNIRFFIADNGEVWGVSRTFVVLNPNIIVQQPTAGARWRADREQTVRWTADQLQGDVKIKLMTEHPDGRLVHFDTIVERTRNDGEYTFTLYPGVPFAGDFMTTISTMRVIVEAADSPPPFREPARGQSELFTLTNTSY